MARTSLAVEPSDATAELLAAKEEIARLRAELDAAPPARPEPEPIVSEPAKQDSDPYGKVFHMPRQLHGIYLRDPVQLQGKHYNPGGKYTKGPFGHPLTVGEVRTILNQASQACHLLATRDVDHGMVLSLGRFSGDAEA
jgi:hypothetical protein